MTTVWDAYEAAIGARCTASKQLGKQRGNLIKRSMDQYDLYLRSSEDDLDIGLVQKRVKVHPYIDKTTIKWNDHKLLNSSASAHESSYNLRFTTHDNFTVTMGYSRYGDEPGVTHLWVKYSAELEERCRRRLQRLLANIGGYRYLGPSMSAGQPVALPVLQSTSETAPEPDQQVKLFLWPESSSSGKKADSEQETEQTMELSARPADIGGYLGPPADAQSSSSVNAGQPVALPVFQPT